jgi:hypothetical protein
MSTPEPAPLSVVAGTTEPLTRLLALRRTLLAEEEAAPSPAVARALEMADMYLFLAISYLGYSEQLFPEEG